MSGPRARWVPWLASFLATLAVSCGVPHPTDVPAPTREVASLRAETSSDLDVLFVIDDNADAQTYVRQSLSALLDPLAAVTGELPNLHIGVVTSDLGTSGSNDPDHPAAAIGTLNLGGCAGTGKDGALQTFLATLTGNFLSDIQVTGGRETNYEGALEDALGQMLATGAEGCAFTQDLRAISRALVNPANAGFLRPRAGLAVIVVGPQDDCSIMDPAMFGPDSSDLGPLSSYYRCMRFGVECDEDITTPGPKTNCRPRASSLYVDDVDGLSGDLERGRSPGSVVVGAIAGPPAPLAVELAIAPSGAQVPWPSGACRNAPGQAADVIADPGVRLASYVDHFGARGTVTSVCSEDYTSQLTEIARVTKQLLGVACIDTTGLGDADPSPGFQPACHAFDELAGASKHLPACPDAGDCFEIAVDPSACPETADHLRLIVHRVDLAPADTVTRLTCDVPTAN